MRHRFRFAAVVTVVAVLLLGLAGAAQAAVKVSRAEVKGTQLRIDGQAAASRPITVDGVGMATSSSSGSFSIDRSGYTSPADCTVDVNDGSATAVNVRLSGCTVKTPGPATLASLTLSNTSLTLVGNLTVGEVLLSSAAVTPVTVALTSSRPGIAPVSSASVQVAAGSNQAVFTVTKIAEVTVQTIVTITASAGGVTKSVPLTINPFVMGITASGELGPGYVGSDFTTSATLGTTIALSTGAVGPASFRIVAGTLPAGLTLKDTNTSTSPLKHTWIAVVGTPTTVGTSTFTVTGTDANGLSATGTYTIVVNPARALTINAQLPWSPVVGSFSNLWLDVSGGVAPYTWVRTVGVYPPGMSLVQSDVPDRHLVRITGTPTTAGTYSFSLKVTDSKGATTTQPLTVVVSP